MKNMNLNESNVHHEVTMRDSFEFFNKKWVSEYDNNLVYDPWPHKKIELV